MALQEMPVTDKTLRNELIVFFLILLASYSIAIAFNNYTILFFGIVIGLIFLTSSFYNDITKLKKTLRFELHLGENKDTQTILEKQYEITVNGVKLKVERNEYIKYLEANQKE